MNTLSAPPVSQPWWKYRHMWMVVSLPLIAVIASFVSLYLALGISRSDPLYDKTHPPVGVPATANHTVILSPREIARNRAAAHAIAAPVPAASAATDGSH